jgi:hypothetical protein
MAFGVNGSGFVTYDPILEGRVPRCWRGTAKAVDVVTYSDPTAFVEPDLRDSVLAGIDRAAELGQSGNPCAGETADRRAVIEGTGSMP